MEYKPIEKGMLEVIVSICIAEIILRKVLEIKMNKVNYKKEYLKLSKENLVDLLIQTEQRLFDAYKVK